MRRLARWTLNGLTVLSLLLCVATCVLWLREYTILWQRPLPPLPPYPAGLHSVWVLNGVLKSTDDWSSGIVGTQQEHWRLPLYWIAIASAPGAYWFLRGLLICLRHRRRPAERCSRCSYDLTGNVSGVCPECGTEVTAGATT